MPKHKEHLGPSTAVPNSRLLSNVLTRRDVASDSRHKQSPKPLGRTQSQSVKVNRRSPGRPRTASAAWRPAAPVRDLDASPTAYQKRSGHFPDTGKPTTPAAARCLAQAALGPLTCPQSTQPPAAKPSPAVSNCRRLGATVRSQPSC